MRNERIGINDLVSIAGVSGIWTVVGTRAAEQRFQVQFRTDVSTVTWVQSEAVALTQKAQKRDVGRCFSLFSVRD